MCMIRRFKRRLKKQCSESLIVSEVEGPATPCCGAVIAGRHPYRRRRPLAPSYPENILEIVVLFILKEILESETGTMVEMG